MTPTRGAVAAVVGGLVAVAARRWGVSAVDDRVLEWQGELHALRHEPGVPPAVRGYRQITFALSLATSRPARAQRPAAAALDTTWGLIGLPRPVLVVLAVPGIAIGLMQGYADAVRDSIFSLLVPRDNSGDPANGITGPGAAFWVGLVLLAGGLVLAATVFSRSWSAQDPAHRRLARLTAVPVLLAAGGQLTRQPSVPAAALVAAAVVLAGAGLWADRVTGARRWLVLVPAGTVTAAVLFVAGRGPETLHHGVVGTAAVTLAVTVFAVRCAAATTRVAPATAPPVEAAAPTTGPGAGSAARTVALVTALAVTMVGAAVLAVSWAGALPVDGLNLGVWAGWRTAIRQAAAVLVVAGLVQLAAVHPRSRLTGDRRRRVGLAVAVVAACCVPSLLLHGRWMWVAVEAARPVTPRRPRSSPAPSRHCAWPARSAPAGPRCAPRPRWRSWPGAPASWRRRPR
ncbi:hypothetical protein Daura_29095 [Dactylosporangium aurantiacum]|uniref:Uncharacterized protein n=1 Tax=Dactylosporangium aurantiacum TaxID=35754 RepID=A0A9Q9MFR0_9ACTN|nr:hypothetical protein [Dactylosporangium aurantiacum]MDG6106711.1 hypothetical protein [Dactylosporangium aurantiacum]UWZ50861.1 hypothetical protein Daura_29095 [Dactylosporangium aurantiacum]